jgi:hypothetical protein
MIDQVGDLISEPSTGPGWLIHLFNSAPELLVDGDETKLPASALRPEGLLPTPT